MSFKKVLLLGSVFLSLIIIIAAYNVFDPVCNYLTRSSYSEGCPAIFYSIWVALWPVLPLTFFSIVTYFMRDEVFKIWAWFSIVWIPVSVLLIATAPNSGGGGWALPRFDAGFFYLVISFFGYILISTLIILGTYIVLWLKERHRQP